MLMGKRPSDYDVATSATPQEVRSLFRRVIMVGAKFGVAIVVDRRRQIEVATFRSDLSYSDGRRPDGVKYVSAREDALRRDFTINAMFYDPIAEQVVDYVGGRKDLHRRIIRAVGDPQVRFSEDYLRMLRAVRFASGLGFRMAGSTEEAIRHRADRITQISGERIREEMEKMLEDASAATALRQMHQLGLLQAVLPELFAREELWPAALRRVEAVAGRTGALGTMAGLLCGLSKGDIRNIIRRWGGSNSLRDSLCWLAEHLHDWKTLPEASLAELKRALAHPNFRQLELLLRVEEKAATGRTASWRAIRGRANRIDPAQVCPRPLLDGEELKQVGLAESPRLGRILKQVYEAQLNERLTTRRDALRYALELIGQERNK